MSLPDLVIFDCDGTLVDTEALQIRVQSELLSGLGLTLDAAYFAQHLTGKRFETILTQLAESHGLNAPADTQARFKAKYRALLEIEDTTITGAREIVLEVAAKTRICIASNGSHTSIKSHIQRMGLMPPLTDSQLFSAVDIGKLKPAPDIFLHAMKQMGVTDASRVIVVEDSYTGLQAALAAETQVVWVKRDPHAILPVEIAGKVRIIKDISHLQKELS